MRAADDCFTNPSLKVGCKILHRLVGIAHAVCIATSLVRASVSAKTQLPQGFASTPCSRGPYVMCFGTVSRMTWCVSYCGCAAPASALECRQAYWCEHMPAVSMHSGLKAAMVLRLFSARTISLLTPPGDSMLQIETFSAC
eukprot:GHVU01021198.1.p2 GENE.GHVU01021198.1~~GHVU01021198.1.p2  ORF type:complete len:141 (-),score=2.70 GHVU01021198.1:86-508(-)